MCNACGKAIGAIRLAAVPGATLCILCQSAQDVPRVRMFVDRVGDDTVETLFTSNALIEDHMRRLSVMTPSREALAAALGDDSHLSTPLTGISPCYEASE